MKVEAVTGWAVIDRNGINVRTVTDTRRAAIVNWLWTKRIGVTNAATDDEIEATWAEESGLAICTTVKISLTEEAT